VIIGYSSPIEELLIINKPKNNILNIFIILSQ